MKIDETTGADRTRRWRQSLRDRRIPETDDIDTAAATALALYLASVERTGSPEGQQVSDALRALVERSLVRAGYDDQASADRARTRIYYLQMLARYPDAPSAQKRLWERGPLPADFTDIHENDEPNFDDDFDHDYEDDEV